MNKKFKKAIATGLTVTTVATSAVGAVIAKHNHDTKVPNNNEYTVQSGDTLYDISNRYYGSGVYYDDLAEYKNIKDADKIKAGDKIKLPAKVGDNVKMLENTDRTYTVDSGDSLTTICDKFYKDGSISTAQKLANYNGLEDVNLIKAGQELKLPEYEDLLKIPAYPYDYELDKGIKK